MANFAPIIRKVYEESRVTDEQLFQYVNDVIVREQLFLDSNFSRQVRHYPFGVPCVIEIKSRTSLDIWGNSRNFAAIETKQREL